MKASTQRFYSLLLSLVFVLGSVFAYVSFIGPEIQKIASLRGEKIAVESTLSDYQKAVDETNKLLSRYKSLADLESSFASAIPTTEEIPSLINQISGLAKLNKITVSSIDFQYPPLDTKKQSELIKPFSTIRTSVKFSGTYLDMKNFIAALESNVRLMDVASISISDGGKKNNPVLSYALTVDAYYQSQ